jgi:hypothetical protein
MDPTGVGFAQALVTENVAGGVIGAVTVQDADAGDTHTFEVSDARFKVAGGNLKLRNGVSLDFETEPTVALTITATDQSGLSTSAGLVVTPTPAT